MEHVAFDALTRRLATPRPRRALLGALAGALLATPTAAAAHRRHRRTKPANPGNGDNPPGHGSTPPGHGGTPPGQGGTPPGQDGNPPGEFQCQPKLFGLCFVEPLGGKGCCDPKLACINTASVFVTACQLLCDTDDDCRRTYPHSTLVCRRDALACPFVTTAAGCCVPQL